MGQNLIRAMSDNSEYFKITQISNILVSSVETFYALQDGCGLVSFTSFHKERKKERKKGRKKERKKERESKKERKKERKKVGKCVIFI